MFIFQSIFPALHEYSPSTFLVAVSPVYDLPWVRAAPQCPGDDRGTVGVTVSVLLSTPRNSTGVDITPV